MHRLLTYTALAISLALSVGCDLASDTGSDRGDPTPALKAVAPAEASPTGLIEVATPAAEKQAPDDVRVLDWDALVPADWRPDKILEELDAAGLSDDDPRAQELAEKLDSFWKEAPVVPELDGKRVKLPGFVVPLEMSAERIDEFLLVPYFGACVHVPPPPANQTVYVVTDPGRAYEGELFDTVWVTGTMKIETTSSELGSAGYRLQAARVEPYE